MVPNALSAGVWMSIGVRNPSRKMEFRFQARFLKGFRSGPTESGESNAKTSLRSTKFRLSSGIYLQYLGGGFTCFLI